MAQVTYGWTPADGAPFDIPGWNADVWSATPGVSLYGELNGRVQDANFDPAMRVLSHHIRPNEGHVSAQAGGTETLDFLDLLFGTDASTSEDDDWLCIGTSGTRVYVPWDATAVVYSAACFATNQRQRETIDPAPATSEYAGPEMYIRMRVDGTGVPHTRRSFPYTYSPSNFPGSAIGYTSREAVLTQHFDLVHVATGGAHALQGWHDVALEVLIPKTQDQENLVPLYQKTGLHPFSLRHRIRFGIRRASILAM